MSGIGVLGPLRVVGEDGALHALRSRQQRVLLAVLVSRRDHSVAGDELVEALWPEELPVRPLAALQSQVFRLRRLVAQAGCELETEGSGYRFVGDRDRLDAARFEHLVGAATARTAEPAVAIGWLDEGLGLWRGRAYLEITDLDVLRGEAARLEEMRAEAWELRAGLLLEVGCESEADRAAEAVMAEHPFREGPVAIRMRALASEGRHADALAVYQRFRRLVGEELGLEPSPQLRSLEGDIVRHDLPRAPRVGLPGNSLVGREVDLAAITGRLDSGRLVTLTGPGGVGKSRLALHAAARAAERYPDGVWLCELATIDSAETVAATAASALHVQSQAEQSHTDRVVQYLASRRGLVVLDNGEHVLDGARALVAAILSHAPEVDVLVTSRIRLGVEGEHVMAVSSLAVPDWDDLGAPAVVLFADRARAVSREFDLTADNAAAVVELCRRLDGLPLAIELAAARTVSRTPQEILTEVSGRLDRLADPGRARDRHRSMDVVVGWSYDRLGDVERDVFRRAAVFAGGFTADAVAEVTGTDRAECVAVLTSLVEHSLVGARDVGGRTRFSMLEPIRQFAEAQLPATTLDKVRERHAVWAARWLERADVGLRSAEEVGWARDVTAEFANLRAAYRWSIDHDVNTAARIAGALYWYSYWYGAPEAFDWAAAVMERGDQIPVLARVAACATATLGACRRGDPADAQRLAQEVIATGDPVDRVATRFVWEALSSAHVMAGDYERALACQQHALAGARRAGDHTHQSREHAARALVFGYLGQTEEARVELATASTVGNVSGCPTIAAFVDYVAGEIAADAAPHSALPRLERARDEGRRIGNRYLVAIAGLSALTTATRAGDPSDALAGFAGVLDYFDRAGSRAQQWTTIRALIQTLTAMYRDEEAAILWGALNASPGAPPLIGPDAHRMNDAVATLAARMGPDRFERLAADGSNLDDHDAIAYARRSIDDGGRRGA